MCVYKALQELDTVDSLMPLHAPLVDESNGTDIVQYDAVTASAMSASGSASTSLSVLFTQLARLHGNVGNCAIGTSLLEISDFHAEDVKRLVSVGVLVEKESEFGEASFFLESERIEMATLDLR